MPTLTEYAQSLETLGGISPLGQSFCRWDGQTFHKVDKPTEKGLYEITSASGRKITALLDGVGIWRRGEWYGLHFLQLHEKGLLLGAKYDEHTWQLALPADQRPPELHERALVLCSGLLPRSQGAWLFYSNVPPQVAESVAAALEHLT
ncbi:hypothetical protein GCM10017783_26300 [Deinococcus piscis]|uniref:Uncharacterized protein n=1 Tax=Deinococcus piscis TaxID=394230 RepID=A0ABQ3KDY3_9DEIO|nr:hypothetical protein GCM10017783_26300 [Deinococcus piscis]